MKDTEILRKAVEKAEKNGSMLHPPSFDKIKIIADEFEIEGIRHTVDEIIFDHDFCRAFFGKKKICQYCGLYKGGHGGVFPCPDGGGAIEEWQHHISQLALSDDRLLYLANHL